MPLIVTRFGCGHAGAHWRPAATRCVIGCRLRSRSGSALAVLRAGQTRVDLLAGRTHLEPLGVTSGDPDLAAERDHRLAGQRALHDLVLADVVREALVVARLLELCVDLLALDHPCGRQGRPRRLRGLSLRCVRVVRVVQPVHDSLQCAHVPSLAKPVCRVPTAAMTPQFIVGSSGKLATNARLPRCRRKTVDHNVSGSDVNGSRASDSTTYQPPARISSSSRPGDHPAYPAKIRSPATSGITTIGGMSRSTSPIPPNNSRTPNGSSTLSPGTVTRPRAESRATGPPWKTLGGSVT